MANSAVPEKHLEIPFSLDEYEDRNIPEFRLEDRLAFWDGPIRAFLRERGYALYNICPVFDGASSLMYPSLETCPQPVDDDRYAFMDPDEPERVLPKAKPGLENTYPYCREKAYARENRGRAAFAQCIARPDRHVAIKLVRDRSVEIHTLKLIFEASKEKSVRGLIPVLEIIPFRGHWLVVMPRWGEIIMSPFPTVAGPVLDLIEDLLEGLTFLHGHNIVHRDHSYKNILVNHIPVVGHQSVREVPPTRQTLRNAGALQHAIFDFDVALIFPDRPSARLPHDEFWLGTPKLTGETMQGEYDYDPFAADVSILGGNLCRDLQYHTPSVPILAPLFDGMLHWDVPSRLTASQALSLLRALRAQYRELDKQPLPDIANKFIDVMEYDRWNGLPPDFVERWGHLRTPPVPWTRRFLRRICRYDFLASCMDATPSDEVLIIPFSLDEYEDRLVPEFRLEDRLAFWDGPIRAFLRERGYALYNICSVFDGTDCSLMYPALDTAHQSVPDDGRYAFMDPEEPGRVFRNPKEGFEKNYFHCRGRAYARENRGRAAYAQSIDRPDRHVAIKLVRSESVEIHTLKLIYDASKREPVRGLIPVLEIIPFGGHWLVVMPRWGEDIMSPFPTLVGPTLSLIEDLLAGLAFLHSHNIVHRVMFPGAYCTNCTHVTQDHSYKNILVNHIPVVGHEEIYDPPPTRELLRNAGVLQHAIFDFDVALIYPDHKSARLPYTEFWLGAFKYTDEIFQGEYDYDPFAADVSILGGYLCSDLQYHTPYVPILAPLFDGMLHWHVPSRLTAPQALELFRSLRAEYSDLDSKPLPAIQDRFIHVSEYDRWAGLPDDFVRRWGHLRTPPVPWTRAFLRRICRYKFLASCDSVHEWTNWLGSIMVTSLPDALEYKPYSWHSHPHQTETTFPLAMKTTALLTLSLALSGASATSWFGSDKPTYSEWSIAELRQWLQEHKIVVPESFSQQQLRDLVQSNWDLATAWTWDQYSSAQKSFADLRDTTFDAWDESRLREFLLEQGVVAPKGPREQLVLLAKAKYADYQNAASTLSAQASTAVYGSPMHQMTKSASSMAAQATREVTRQMDDTKDYVYSTWEDNKLRSYLVEKGVLAKDAAEKTRNEMLAMMRDTYVRATQPIWEAWSHSYMREWLIAHDLITPPAPSTPEIVKAKMSQYYYDVNDRAWTSWTDSDMNSWLVSHNIIKSDAQIQREKLTKLIEDNYLNARDTLWESWSDSQMRDWLAEHGEKNVPAKRDQLVKLMQNKYNDAAGMSAAYLTWPDARLRAYLRNRGIDESGLPTSRPGLLQETRIRWVQAMTSIERIKELINSGIEITEEKLASVLQLLSGQTEKAKAEGEKIKADAKKVKADAKKNKENLKTEL
ncbi:unnamed protein product [Mycena citricolor]|uniref:Protein kinase domain-containing protein n=1 Tax=Mycena citricolor TaxID=2018698 RepID=A0AAD2JWK9_9AGAR|nr:unnamed protein product [Mycena citricolor]